MAAKKKDVDEVIEIAIHQAVAELAEGQVEDELLGTEGFLDEEDLYMPNSETRYHPDAQEVYDRAYDYFYDVIKRATI